MTGVTEQRTAGHKPLRILVVDDTVVYRKIVSDVLAEMPEVEVAGTASNGKIALAKISTLKPDVLTLDIEMPEMTGLEVLSRMASDFPEVGAIVLSTLTQEGSEMTLKALELGAFDFIPKPQSGTMADNKQAMVKALRPMLRAFDRRSEIRKRLRGTAGFAASSGSPKSSSAATSVTYPARVQAPSEIVAIGISTGGPNALARMMPKLPADLGVPMVVVQHMPPKFTTALARSLDAKCALKVQEAADGQPLRPNEVLIAPGGTQMRIVAAVDGVTRVVRVTNDPPENSCKPSADYLFRSVADHYTGRATGVIMTGMGVDGANGLKRMREGGSTIIAQDESSCTVFGMPKEAIEAGVVDIIAPLDRIADEIAKTVRKRA